MNGAQGLKQKTIATTIPVVLLVSVLTLAITQETAHGSGPTLYVEPTANAAYVGKSFTINIEIQNVINLFSHEAKLGFNKAVLEPVAVQEGPFIRDQTTSPQGTFFLHTLEDDFVHVACLTLGNYPGVSGSGVLFNVTFNVLDDGTSTLHLYDTILLDSTITEIPHGTIDGTVVATILGDINNDGIVNVLDLTIVSLAYGAFAGEPGYNPDADLNGDGFVDMKDMVIVAWNLGKS